MRNPNGYGGISHLGGNRRNPFRVRITTGWEYNQDTGKTKQKYSVLGYYPSRKEAMMALAEYNKNPYDLDKNNITFAEIYERWSKEELPGKGQSVIYAYEAAYAKCETIQNIKMADLKKAQLQAVMDSINSYSKSTQDRVKTLIRQCFRYCREYDILEKDYSEFIKGNAINTPSEIHCSWTTQEIKFLWDNLDAPIELKYSAKDIRNIYPVDTILIMIYTGLRPGELLQIKCENVNIKERYMRGGLKTKAGKNRIIPIHDDILPLVTKRVETGNQWLIPYKSDNPPNMGQYRQYMFDKIIEKLKLSHLPHDGRHTFATFADRAEINPLITKRIMGHKANDITKDVYTHKEIYELVDAVNKITFREK